MNCCLFIAWKSHHSFNCCFWLVEWPCKLLLVSVHQLHAILKSLAPSCLQLFKFFSSSSISARKSQEVFFFFFILGITVYISELYIVSWVFWEKEFVQWEKKILQRCTFYLFWFLFCFSWKGEWRCAKVGCRETFTASFVRMCVCLCGFVVVVFRAGAGGGNDFFFFF